MNSDTIFWQEFRRGIMGRNDNWKDIIETLPEYISFAKTLDDLQSADQLTVLQGKAHIAGSIIETHLNKEIILPFLSKNYTLENIVVQWLYRFIVVRSMVKHNQDKPMIEWAPMFLHLTEQGLHFMVVMAALLVFAEKAPINENEDLSIIVKFQVAHACELIRSKERDYGQSWRDEGLPGLLPRLWDKIARYTQLKADNRLGNFEKKEDSLMDLLGYCIIAYSIMLELPAELRKSYQPIGTFETDRVGGKWVKIQ